MEPLFALTLRASFLRTRAVREPILDPHSIQTQVSGAATTHVAAAWDSVVAVRTLMSWGSALATVVRLPTAQHSATRL